MRGNFTTTDGDVVCRARLELHDAAAAFAIARIEPERQRVAPRVLAGFAEAHRTSACAGISGRCPIDAERFESGGYESEKKHAIAHGGWSIARRLATNPPRLRWRAEYRCRVNTDSTVEG